MQEVFSRSLDFQGGLTGCQVISNTSANTGAFQGFVVNEDAVIAQVLNSAGTNVTSSMGLSSVTINQGMLITAPKGDYFSSITLTSGSVVAYLK
jgi:uncharacterized protein YaiI (UPF0178 family)